MLKFRVAVIFQLGYRSNFRQMLEREMRLSRSLCQSFKSNKKEHCLSHLNKDYLLTYLLTYLGDGWH